MNFNFTTLNWHKMSSNDNVWISWRFSVIKFYLKKIINLNHPYECLDIGSGYGNFSKQIEEETNFTSDSVDVDNNIKKKIRTKGKFFYYDINTRKLKKKYDIIFLLDVLEHIDNQKKFLDSCFFHLKKGGLMVINVPALNIFYSNYDKAVGHIRRYNLYQIKSLFKNKNIIILKYWGILLIPLLLMRKILLIFKKNEKDIIELGMDTNSMLKNLILKSLKKIELNFIKQSFVGSSIICIVKK